MTDEEPKGGCLWAPVDPADYRPFNIDPSVAVAMTAEEIRECFEEAYERPRKRHRLKSRDGLDRIIR